MFFVPSLMTASALIAASALLAPAQDRGTDQERAKAGGRANPVKATPQSVATGKRLYDKTCSPCHGAAAKGDGKMAAQLDPKPADLTPGVFKHGSSDGELFATIRDGSKGTAMKGFGGSLSAEDIWNLVNYLRTLGPTPPSPQ